MQSVLGSEHQKSGPSAPCALWAVDLKLTHLDWDPEAILIHFQGQYQTICELDYNILQGEIQNVPKTKAAVDIGEFCLVEDLTSGRWYRGRVQNQKEDLFDVFLIDHGNVLSVDFAHLSSCSNSLFILPPKIVCGFLANVLLLQGSSHSVVEVYLSTLIGSNVTGYIQALLPHNVLLLEARDINNDLVKHGFGRHVDTDTFILLVGMLTEVPLKQSREPEPAPDLLIVKPRGQEFCHRPCGLQGYKDILSFCGPSLSCGTCAKVRVTAAVSAGLFYCQMTSMETELREMSEKLAAVNEEHNPETSENVGLLCSVKGKDGKWYRGFVQCLPVNSQLQVLFIDYGFSESVKVENVRSLPLYLYSTPVMAFPCSLSSLSDQAEEVKAQQLSFLKAGLLGRVLDVEITSFDEEKYLYSMTVIGADDYHVNELEPIQELARMKVKSVFETEELSPQCDCLYYETVMGKALDQTLEAGEVAVDSIFVGYVEHVQNPNNFWIRTQKRNDEFEEMMTEMANNFSQVKLDEEVLLNPEPGTLCCAVYEKDMHFYRGVVTDTLEHGAEVLFIDFGNIEKVPHMLIKKIPEKFSSKSAFAFCCTLVNVLPEDDVWTSATSDFFRQAVSNKALQVHVVQMRKNKFVVDLHEMGSDNNQSITELLISRKQATYWNNIPTEPVVQNNTDVTDETKCSRYRVTSDINGNTEQLEDWEKSEKTFKNLTGKSEAPYSFKALGIKPGCDFAVCCSCIESPSNFWCQPLVKVPALDKLMDEIQRYYSTHTAPLQSEDTCCVAKSPLDGKWYRAFITEKQNGHAKVMLVDYGFNLSIKEHSLMAIMTEYLHLEVQAFRCSLYNLIKPSDTKNCEDWSPEVCKLLKDFALNCTSGLRCTVVSQLSVKNKGLCNVVELYNTQTQQSITKLVLEQDPSSKVTHSTKQLSTVYPESFVYSSFDLSPGNQEQVYITHVSSQWEVYCHLDRNTETIEELTNKISKESKKMMQASTREVVRKLCLAKYFDGKWYRGLAHPVQSSLHLGVFFVDYGNTNISEKTHVMFIPRDSTDLLYTPMQALRCNLASVSKEVLYADAKEWLDGEILNKQVRVVIVGKNEDGSFNVELFDGDVNINEKVQELIVGLLPKPKTVVSFEMSNAKTKKKTHAKTCVKSRSQCKGQSSDSTKWKAQRRTQVGSSPNKAKEKTKNCVQKALNKMTQLKQQNEDNTKRSGPIKPQKTSEIKQERQYLETNTKSEKTVDTAIPQLSDMKVSAGFRAKCFISHIDSVNSFFLQLSEDEPAILKMVEDLNSSILRDSLTTATSLRISDLVVAEYEEDGTLYRSVVKDFEGSSCFKVEFVDYGNSAVVGKEKIYSIPKEYVSQPRLSISCSLLDTSKYKNDASFTDAVMEKPLMVDFVRQRESHWEVKLEILDGAVGPPAVLEAAGESSSETRNEEEASVSSSETEDRESDSGEDYPRKEVSENETTKSERMTPTIDDEKLIHKTSPATLSPELEARSEKVQELIVGLLPKPKTVVSFEMSNAKTKNKTHAMTCVKSRSQCKGQSSDSTKWEAQRRTQVGSAPDKEKEKTKNCVQKALNKMTQLKQQNEDNTKCSGPIKPQKTSEIKQERQYLETNTESEKPVDTAIPQLSDLKVSAGFRAKCFISHIDSVNSFFLQLSEDEPAILKMVEDLNSSILRDSLTTTTSLRISDLVVAEYEEDSALYRSVVKDFEGSSCFKVEFVDYGNSAVVGKEKIYSIPKEYVSQPRLSISCSLLDTSKYKNDASFTDAVMEKPLMVDFVRQHGSHWEVKLEILDGAVGPPAVLEAAGESSSETRNEEEASVSSSETEDRESDSGEDYPRKEVSENETTKSERMTPTVDDEKLIHKTSPATLSPKLEARRAPTRNMDDSENERETSESKRDCSDEVIPQIIQAKDTEYGTLLSVLSNGSFYTRLKKTSQLLASLESHITDNLYKCEMVPEEDVKQYLKCLVQVQKEKKWHRAVVEHVGPGKCQVLLVDHGRKEEIPSDLIRKQCNELTKTPHLAVLCKVNSLGFSKGDDAHKLWYETLKPMIGEELKLVFECYSEADDLWMVEIVISGLFPIRQITASLQQNEETVMSIAETQTKNAECQCDLDLSPPQQLVFAPVDIDKAYSGFAASVSTPFEFNVVLEDLLLIMSKVSIMLEDLPGQMPSLPEAHLVPGTCCLLKSDTKNKWCRAEIINVNNTVVLKLVDYGHHESIPYEDCSKLRRISEEMTNIPKVTYPCVLRGVKPVRADGQWTDEAAGFFQQCLYLRDLQIFFREFVSNTHWTVDILTEGKHVAKKLVDAGHASYMDIMLGLRFQEQSPCKAVSRSPDSEEKCGQEDEGSDGKSEEKMPLGAVSATRHCFLM